MEEIKSDFCIRIDFEKQTENPQRVFMAMSDLIVAFQELDVNLSNCIVAKIEPVLLLEDIETGSLKTWLSTVIKRIPDEAILDLDWKKAVGHYLVKAKYIILNNLEGKLSLTDAREIIDIQAEILEAAKETKVSQLDTYSPIQPKLLVSSIDKINKSLSQLSKGDTVEYLSNLGNATFNLELSISPDNLDDLITKEKIESNSRMILKVKKPDYLGESMWEFKHENKLIKAKLSDVDWVDRFQKRKVDVRPGDSIRADVRITVKYGYDFSVVDTSHEIVKVIEVIENQFPNQHVLNL